MLIVSISIFDTQKGQLKSALINRETIDSLFGATLDFLNETYGREIKIIEKKVIVIDDVEVLEVQYLENDVIDRKNQIGWEGHIFFDEESEFRDPSYWSDPKRWKSIRKMKIDPRFDDYAITYSDIVSSLIGALSGENHHSNVECIVV